MGQIRSMTAFARETTSTPLGTLTVELRSVNHRYLDLGFRLPDSLRGLEPALREQATSTIARGKIECQFRLHSDAGSQGGLRLNREHLRAVLEAAEEVRRELPDARPLDPLAVLQFPGVCTPPEISECTLQSTTSALFDSALESLSANRAREGSKLALFVRERLELVARETHALRGQLPELRERQQERLLARLAELQQSAEGVRAEPDTGRLEQELVYLAQRADVDEELDRLESHIEEVRRTLDQGGPCGRRLDFLMQELNREANTLSSKSTASSSTHSAVEMKVLIEQMREQVQNIE